MSLGEYRPIARIFVRGKFQEVLRWLAQRISGCLQNDKTDAPAERRQFDFQKFIAALFARAAVAFAGDDCVEFHGEIFLIPPDAHHFAFTVPIEHRYLFTFL